MAGTALPRPRAIGDLDSDFRAPGLTIPRKQRSQHVQPDVGDEEVKCLSFLLYQSALSLFASLADLRIPLYPSIFICQ